MSDRPDDPPPYGQVPYGHPPPGQPPPGQPPYGQPPYGQPPQLPHPPPGYGYGYGYGYVPYGAPGTMGVGPYQSRGTTVAVLGIVSIAGCFFCALMLLLGPVAWQMGRSLKAEAEANGWPEPGNGQAGRICGMISTILLLIGLTALVVVLVAAAASSN